MDDLDEILSAVESKSFSTAGRGRKKCPDCNKIIGARLKECSCGHAFKKADSSLIERVVEKKNEDSVVDESIFSYIKGLGLSGKRFLTIYTPSGKCPFNLTEISEESIKDFCESVIDFGVKQKPSKLYLPSAIKYWITVNCREDKLQKALEYFTKWMEQLNEIN